MKKSNQLTSIMYVLGLVVLLALGYWWYDSQQPGQYDRFAQCLGERGSKFYGAFWCPHCQAQKALFGKSKDFLPYVECSTPDTKGQLQVCKDKNIQSYPTWEFKTASGTELVSGERTLSELSLKTGCALEENK
jgi:thiol-disulfide isomerase/thioredoxin